MSYGHIKLVLAILELSCGTTTCSSPAALPKETSFTSRSPLTNASRNPRPSSQEAARKLPGWLSGKPGGKRKNPFWGRKRICLFNLDPSRFSSNWNVKWILEVDLFFFFFFIEHHFKLVAWVFARKSILLAHVGLTVSFLRADYWRFLKSWKKAKILVTRKRKSLSCRRKKAKHLATHSPRSSKMAKLKCRGNENFLRCDKTFPGLLPSYCCFHFCRDTKQNHSQVIDLIKSGLVHPPPPPPPPPVLPISVNNNIVNLVKEKAFPIQSKHRWLFYVKLCLSLL